MTLPLTIKIRLPFRVYCYAWPFIGHARAIVIARKLICGRSDGSGTLLVGAKCTATFAFLLLVAEL